MLIRSLIVLIIGSYISYTKCLLSDYSWKTVLFVNRSSLQKVKFKEVYFEGYGMPADCCH